jgi:hypothetical protein
MSSRSWGPSSLIVQVGYFQVARESALVLVADSSEPDCGGLLRLETGAFGPFAALTAESQVYGQVPGVKLPLFGSLSEPRSWKAVALIVPPKPELNVLLFTQA